MAKLEILMPSMGESIFECTVLKWLVNIGDSVDIDDMILEVATDKIDTEIGSSHKGTITKFFVDEGETAYIGKPICEISTEISEPKADKVIANLKPTNNQDTSDIIIQNLENIKETYVDTNNSLGRFYSPLVQNIAKQEKISQKELDAIPGTGLENRLTKDDLLLYIKNKTVIVPTQQANVPAQGAKVSVNAFDQVVEMDRMRKMIAQRMVDSKKVSPHVTSFIETDMTAVVTFRNNIKDNFKAKLNQSFTFTPILIKAVADAIKKFPGINIQVDGENIIYKNNINIGMAVALPSGNLIVPIIHNADKLKLEELALKVNDLASRARENKLKAEELVGGTYTITNIGNFGNLSGTPIILQPQVAIMAFGVIRKMPAVIETPEGDFIGIRQKMIISHSYDHRVVDGSLGGMFLKEVSDNLEQFKSDGSLNQ